MCLCGTVCARGDTTLIVYNHVTSAPPEKIVLQLNFKSGEVAHLLPAEMTNRLHAVRPFSGAVNSWTLTIHHVESGNLRFGHDPDDLVQSGVETGYEVLYDGFVEFTVKSTDATGWWNLSNVDWIGVLCGLRCTHGGFDPGPTWTMGYGKRAAEMIGIINDLYEFTADESNQVMKLFPLGVKLMAPTKYPNTYAESAGGRRSVRTYLDALSTNHVPELLLADWWNVDAGSPANNPVNWNNRVPTNTAVEFEGGFRWYEDLSSIGISDGRVVHVLSNQEYGVQMYLTTNALNPATILRGDSEGGCWVRYLQHTNQPDDWTWTFVNAHLNCIASNSPFGQWCASLTKKVITPINNGLIPTNANPATVFNYSGFDWRMPLETNTWARPPYPVNLYNLAIVTNSDSYGMSYSDAAYSTKVLAQTQSSEDPVVELHILDPQADPSAYYSKTNSGGNYQLVYRAGAGGAISGAATQSVASGQNGAAVTAILGDTSVVFHAWSDGRSDNPRIDTNVHANVIVNALFRSQGGADLDWYVAHGYTPEAGEVWSDLDAKVVAAKNSTLLRECIADTDPSETGDVFRVVGIKPSPPVTVQFEPGSTGRLYTFQFAGILADGLWSNVPGTAPRYGSGGPDEMLDTNGAPAAIYRIQVQMP